MEYKKLYKPFAFCVKQLAYHVKKQLVFENNESCQVMLYDSKDTVFTI